MKRSFRILVNSKILDIPICVPLITFNLTVKLELNPLYIS